MMETKNTNPMYSLSNYSQLTIALLAQVRNDILIYVYKLRQQQNDRLVAPGLILVSGTISNPFLLTVRNIYSFSTK